MEVQAPWAVKGNKNKLLTLIPVIMTFYKHTKLRTTSKSWQEINNGPGRLLECYNNSELIS